MKDLNQISFTIGIYKPSFFSKEFHGQPELRTLTNYGVKLQTNHQTI